MLTGTLQSVLNYPRDFEENYCEQFGDMCVIDILEDVMSSASPAASSRATYIRCSKAGKMMMKHSRTLLD